MHTVYTPFRNLSISQEFHSFAIFHVGTASSFTNYSISVCFPNNSIDNEICLWYDKAVASSRIRLDFIHTAQAAWRSALYVLQSGAQLFAGTGRKSEGGRVFCKPEQAGMQAASTAACIFIHPPGGLSEFFVNFGLRARGRACGGGGKPVYYSG